MLRAEAESGIDASDIFVYGEGVNGRNGRLKSVPRAAKVGVQARCMANLVVWDGKDAIGRQVTSGVYLYRLAAGSNAVVKKMILAK